MESLEKIKGLLIEISGLIASQKTDSLDPEIIDEVYNLSREFHEHFIYLKLNKSASLKISEPVKETFKDAFVPSKNKIKNPNIKKDDVYNDLENLETELTEVSENQTTLIEIIEEIQEDDSINARIAKGKTKETLADKHSKQPISNLDNSIGINQRFSFIKNLFGNDKDAYEESMETLNSCAGFIEADDYIQNTLKKKFNWSEETVHVIKFIDLVERRYLPYRE